MHYSEFYEVHSNFKDLRPRDHLLLEKIVGTGFAQLEAHLVKSVEQGKEPYISIDIGGYPRDRCVATIAHKIVGPTGTAIMVDNIYETTVEAVKRNPGAFFRDPVDRQAYRKLRTDGIAPQAAIDVMRLMGIEPEPVSDIWGRETTWAIVDEWKPNTTVKKLPYYHHKRRF